MINPDPEEPTLSILTEIVLMGDAVEKIGTITDTAIPDIIEALIGIAWDEEFAGQLTDYHTNEEDV